MEKDSNITIKRQTLKKLYQKNFNEMKSISMIDILFILDVTGSMDPYQDLLKNSVSLISEKLLKFQMQENNPQSKLSVNFAMLCYRDKKDQKQFELFGEVCEGENKVRFTNDTKKLMEDLNTVKCQGGGDSCEDIKGALQQVLKFEFTSHFKFLILITDCPAHGKKYHDPKHNLSDDYESEDMSDELKTLAKKEIVFLGIKFTDHVSKMYQEIESEYKLNHGKFFLIDENDLKNIKKNSACTMNIVNLFSQRISEPIYQDFGKETLKMTKEKKISRNIQYACEKHRDYKIKFSDANYNRECIINIELEVCLLACDQNLINYSNLDEFKIVLYQNFAIWNAFLPNSRAFQGSFKDVYLLKVMNEGNKEEKFLKYLAKVPLNEKYYKSQEEILKEWKGIVVARKMAEMFQKEVWEKVDGKVELEIYFNDIFIVKAKNKDQYYAVERVIEGPFAKYNNNMGWVDEFPKDQIKENSSKWEFESFNKLAQAFTHYTFQKSNGFFIVCDLQGCVNHLTDPMIITKKISDNHSNTGPLGILAFFHSHKCNHVCKSLGLEEMEANLPAHIKEKIEEIQNSNQKSKINEAKEEEELKEEEDNDKDEYSMINSKNNTNIGDLSASLDSLKPKEKK